MSFGKTSKYYQDLERKCGDCLYFGDTLEGQRSSPRTGKFETIGMCDNAVVGPPSIMGTITAGDICDEHRLEKDPLEDSE